MDRGGRRAFEVPARDRDRDCVHCLDAKSLRVRRPSEVGASLVPEFRLSLFGFDSMGVPAEQSPQSTIGAKRSDRGGGCIGPACCCYPSVPETIVPMNKWSVMH
jgi:hypothetical protein